MYSYCFLVIDPSVFIKEGDIYTSIREEEEKLNFIQAAPSARKPTVVFSWHMKLWPRNIPFKIGSSFSQEGKRIVHSESADLLRFLVDLCISLAYYHVQHWGLLL